MHTLIRVYWEGNDGGVVNATTSWFTCSYEHVERVTLALKKILETAFERTETLYIIIAFCAFITLSVPNLALGASSSLSVPLVPYFCAISAVYGSFVSYVFSLCNSFLDVCTLHSVLFKPHTKK